MEESARIHRHELVNSLFPFPFGDMLTKLSAHGFSLPTACLALEYYYARVYCFSPAAHVLHSRDRYGNDDIDRYQSAFSQFLNEATKASIDILNSIVNVLAPSKVLRYVGVRYWIYVVCACLFVLKVS